MIRKIKNQNISFKAFTLVEMVIVLVVIGIMLMATVYLSGEQIQKVKNKTVKESILAEMQSRYSRNLWSSSYGSWKMYDTMEITMKKNWNTIDSSYLNDDQIIQEDTFTDRFEIRYIKKYFESSSFEQNDSDDTIILKYTPYKITCKIMEEGNDKENTNAVIVTRVNNSKDYCFEISQKNCRLIEMSEKNCCTLEKSVGLDNNCNL